MQWLGFNFVLWSRIPCATKVASFKTEEAGKVDLFVILPASQLHTLRVIAAFGLSIRDPGGVISLNPFPRFRLQMAQGRVNHRLTSPFLSV